MLLHTRSLTLGMTGMQAQPIEQPVRTGGRPPEALSDEPLSDELLGDEVDTEQDQGGPGDLFGTLTPALAYLGADSQA
jgi:hypothetical protein